jgi:hypothetical protein
MKLSTLLLKQAKEIRSQSPEVVAVDMLKKAGMSDEQARMEVSQKLMEKEATNYLTASGIDYDTALQMVKVADVKLSSLASFKPEPSTEEIFASQFEKAAELAKALEAKAEEADALLEKVAQLEAQIEETPTVETVSEPMAKFAASGTFTNDDLKELMKLSTSTLTKVAAVQEQPWRMGKSAGTAVEDLDPIAQFCLS